MMTTVFRTIVLFFFNGNPTPVSKDIKIFEKVKKEENPFAVFFAIVRHNRRTSRY
jgi:hypothetical protein